LLFSLKEDYIVSIEGRNKMGSLVNKSYLILVKRFVREVFY